MQTFEDGISERDLVRICELIYAEAGINLSPEKRVMIEVRLKRRLRELNFDSYDRYCRYLFAPRHQHDEVLHLIDVMTTNKTDFFREPAHFHFLEQKALGELRAAAGNRELRFWSAGCSTGEEPYTLAMVLDRYASANAGLKFRVFATDISSIVLEKAKRAVFNSAAVAPVMPELRRKYFMRSRDPESDCVRVVPELRSAIEFQRLNLMDDFRWPEPMDGIFCRNVIIYFDRATQERLLLKLSKQLVAGGYLFMGHSETLHDMQLPLAPVAPALYRKIDCCEIERELGRARKASS